MKVTAIVPGSTKDGAPIWLICMEGGSVMFQRRGTRTATESPLSLEEELVCELCEFALRRGEKP